MANIKHVNSIVDRDFRNRINQLIDAVNNVGTSIDELVVKGVLTTEQYTQLLTAINGLVKTGEVDIDSLNDELRNKVKEIDSKLESGNVTLSDIDKSGFKLDGTFFSQEFLTELNKGVINATNVLPKSIGSSEIMDNSIVEENVKFIKKSKNLFNKNDVTLNLAIEPDGSIIYNKYAGVMNSFIPVNPNTSYHKSGNGHVAFYDANFNFKRRLTYTSANVFTTNSDEHYIKVSLPIDRLETYQVEEGTAETPYEPYYRLIDEELIKISGDKIIPETLSIDDLTGFEKSKNLINNRRLVNGYIDKMNGEIVSSNTINTSTENYIAIKENTHYVISPIPAGNGKVNIVFYDENKVWISYDEITSASESGSFTTPVGSKYLRLSYPSSLGNRIQLELGTSPTPYEPYYNYIPSIVTPSESAEQDDASLSKPNILEVLAPYDVRFSFPIDSGRYSSFRFSNYGTKDDFMKGQESSILNDKLDVIYNLTNRGSNKEFAISVSETGNSSDWFPEHNGVSTAVVGDVGFRKLTLDGNEVDMSERSVINKQFKKATLTQKMELKLPYDDTPRAILTFVVTLEDGECHETVRIEWKKDSFVNNGYFFMTPMNTTEFVDNLLTSDFEFLKSKPEETTQTHSVITNRGSKKFYFTSDRTGKTDILFTTEYIHNSREVTSLFFQHRKGYIEKLYPKYYDDTTVEAGEIDYFEGKYSIDLLNNANEIYKLN